MSVQPFDRRAAGSLLATLMAIVLSSCSVAPIAVEATPVVPASATAAPTAMAGAANSEQAAIAAALKYATLGDGHIMPGQESPRISRLKLAAGVIRPAISLLRMGCRVIREDSITNTIWLITLDGTWIVNGPPQLPGITPPPLAPLHHLVIVLDAATGAVGPVSGRPVIRAGIIYSRLPRRARVSIEAWLHARTSVIYFEWFTSRYLLLRNAC